jgi:antitoxin component YwqK of YwqJK toxin-antitoxin module
MKKQIAILFLFFISFLGHSQFSSNDRVFYLDSLKQLTTSENYKYIRVVKDYSLVKELYDALIYYKSGKIEMRSTVVKDNNNLKFEGPCVFYFENGNRRKIVNYSDNKLIGKQFEWFENGNIKSETEIVIDKKKKTETTRILQFWDENNIKQ